jgi:hypothetical protein
MNEVTSQANASSLNKLDVVVAYMHMMSNLLAYDKSIPLRDHSTAECV